jgi:hypothetical protein
MYRALDKSVEKGKYGEAAEEIGWSITGKDEKGRSRKKLYSDKDKVLQYLDKGMLEHFAGNYEESYNDLLNAGAEIEAAFTKSVSEGIGTYITNDNAATYPGEDYEDIYAGIFNALNAYYLNNGQAYALVNSLTAAGGKLQVLNSKYADEEAKAEAALKKSVGSKGGNFSYSTITWPAQEKITFSNSVLARFLGAYFSLANGNKDSARYNMFELKNAYNTPPYAGIRIPQNLIVQGERGDETGDFLDIPAGKGQLNILSFSGLSGIKTEEVQLTYFPFLLHKQFQYAYLKVPKLEKRSSKITGIEAYIEGNDSALQLDLLEDMDAVIADTFRGGLYATYLKTYTRVITKHIIADVTALTGDVMSAAAEDDGTKLGIDIFRLLFSIGANIGIASSEAADIRMARYLPSKVHYGAVNLDPGTYNVNVVYQSTSGAPVVETKTVTITRGRHSLIETICLK